MGSSAEMDMVLVKSCLLKRLILTGMVLASVVVWAGAGPAWAAERDMPKFHESSPSIRREAGPIGYAGMCDIYGNGFFYLPGTDSCLKVGGLVYGELRSFSRSDSVNGQTFEGNGTPPVGGGYVPNRGQYVTAGQRDAVGYRTLGRLELDARKATSYGPVRAFVRADTLFGSNDNGLIAGAPSSTYDTNVRSATILDKAFLQFAGLTAGYAQSMFDFYADADNWGYLRGSNATVPLLAYTATFGKGFSSTLSFEDHYWRRAAIGSTIANFQAMPTHDAVPDIVGNLRLDQPWGAIQLSGAAHQIRSNLFGTTPAGNLAGRANSNSDFGFAVQGGLEFNTDMIAPGDKLWLQAAYEKGAYSYVGGDNRASAYGPVTGSRYFGSGISPQDYNFGWNPQLPSDCVYTGLTAATATCGKSSGFAFTGAFKHYWTPTLSSAVFGSYLSTNYDANALNGLGGAVGVADTKETRIGGSLVWTPIKGLNIGTEFMYLHLSQSTPAGIAPNYGATSLSAAGVPTFKNNSNEYEGRIRVQRAF